MRSCLFVVPLVAAAVACGGSSSDRSVPTAPAPPAAPPAAASTWSLGGVVTDVITGQGVAGATLAFTGLQSVATDSAGRWQLQGSGSSPGTTTLGSTITAPGFQERQTRVEWRSGGRSDVALSLLPERSPFSLDFFRKLVRNGYEEPELLEPIRRWTSNPSFYLNAHNPRTGAKLVTSEIDMIESTVRKVIPQITGGQFSVAAFEVGTAPRSRRVGYINIDIVYEPEEDFCADAFVGANPGLIRLNYEACRVSWCRDAISPNVVAHEVGHAMGLWHVPGGIMVAELDDCRGVTFNADEQLHARVAYQRPNGNRDVDIDPISFQAVTTGDEPRITCRKRR